MLEAVRQRHPEQGFPVKGLVRGLSTQRFELSSVEGSGLSYGLEFVLRAEVFGGDCKSDSSAGSQYAILGAQMQPTPRTLGAQLKAASGTMILDCRRPLG